MLAPHELDYDSDDDAAADEGARLFARVPFPEELRREVAARRSFSLIAFKKLVARTGRDATLAPRRAAPAAPNPHPACLPAHSPATTADRHCAVPLSQPVFALRDVVTVLLILSIE